MFEVMSLMSTAYLRLAGPSGASGAAGGDSACGAAVGSLRSALYQPNLNK